MTRSLLTSFVFIIFCAFSAIAQTGKISGVVKAAGSNAIDGATISLLKAKDSSLAKLAITDKTGAYEFLKIPYGSYLLKAEAVGFEKSVSKVFAIDVNHATITHDEIAL